MRKSFLLATAALVALAAAPAGAQTIIESFENDADWTVAGNDITTNGASASVAVNTTDYTEGTGSIALTYNYSGNAYYEVSMTKSFTTPIDMSNAMEVSFDIKGDTNGETDLVWYAKLTDSYGQNFKIYSALTEEGGALVASPKADGWKTYTWSIPEMSWDEWVNQAWVPATLNEIASVSFFLQKNDGTATAASSTILFDNLRFSDTTARVTETVLDNFDYADTAAFESGWNNIFGNVANPPSTTISLNTSNVAEGTGAGDFTFDMPAGSQNLSTGRLLPLASTTDFSNVIAFELMLDGDPAFPASAPLLMVGLEDTAVQRARFRAVNGLKNDGYDRLIMYPKTDAPTQFGAVNGLEQEAWDADGGSEPFTDVDLSQITKVYVYLLDGGTAFPYNATATIDGFKYYTSNGLPFESEAGATSARDWEMYQ